MMKVWACLVAWLAAVPVFAQSDDIDFRAAGMYNSPADIASWPATAHLTRVTFFGDNWSVDFDRRLSNPWPDMTPDGWTGPLQYTLGMCLNRGGWQCSAVVEFWQHRLEQEGPISHAPVDQIAAEWFYSAAWGPLQNQQPAHGETVALFVTAGDTRNRREAWPTALRERSDVRLIHWGSSQAFGHNTPAPEPSPVPQPVPVPTPPPAPPPLMLSGDFLLSAQAERMFADLVNRDNAKTAQIAALAAAVDKHDHEPAYLTKILGNRYVQLVLAGAGTWLAKQELFK